MIVSALFPTGFRSGTLGSAASLAMAFPLAEGDPDVLAVSAATRTGWYADRTLAAERIGTVVEGVDVFQVYKDRCEILGFEVLTLNSFDPADYQLRSEQGLPLGYPSLDITGKIPLSQLPSSVVGGVIYQGTWNANTNSPMLTSGVGTLGWYYVVSVAGTTTIDGISDWQVGDWIVFNGTIWQKVDNSESFQVLGDVGDPTPGYLDAKVDNVTIHVNASHQLEVLSTTASSISTDTTNFNSILSAADDDVQKALDTLDDHTHAFTGLSDVTHTGYVALTDATPVVVDTDAVYNVWKWLLSFHNTVTGEYQAVEILGATVSAASMRYTIYPATTNFSHTVTADRTASVTTLIATASGTDWEVDVIRLGVA